MSVVDGVAWVSVPLVDDYERPYPRPDVLEISGAHDELVRLDEAGELPATIVPPVRVLLAVLGRMSAGDMAEAFHPSLRSRPVLRTVATGDEL